MAHLPGRARDPLGGGVLTLPCSLGAGALLVVCR